MNVNAILGSSEDKTEVQLAYKELINTILFELALIPIINQASVDLLIFFATISLTMILLSHHGSRIIQKRKDPSQAQSSRGKIGYLLHYLCIMGLGGLTIMNFFYLYDWIKLLLLLPIVIYSGIIILHCSKYKKDGVFPPYFNDKKITTVLQVWLTISIIGLALYNLTYSHLPTIITTILCLGSILLILVDSYSNTRV